MTVSAGVNSASEQTFGNAFEDMFVSTEGNGGKSSVCKVNCTANGMIVRINGSDNNLVTIPAGQTDYLESIEPGGIFKLEGKNMTTDSAATGFWSARIAI